MEHQTCCPFEATRVFCSCSAHPVCLQFNGFIGCYAFLLLFSCFLSKPKQKQAKTLLESELQKWYFAFFSDFYWRSPETLRRLFEDLFVLYLIVFWGSQDKLWILRYSQSPLLSHRLRIEKLLFSGFWVAFAVETRVGPKELLLLYLLMMLGHLESCWLLRSKHFFVSCLVEIRENKRTIHQQSSQQDDPCMKKPMGTKKEMRETLSCFNSLARNKTNQPDHARTTCRLTPYSN